MDAKPFYLIVRCLPTRVSKELQPPGRRACSLARLMTNAPQEKARSNQMTFALADKLALDRWQPRSLARFRQSNRRQKETNIADKPMGI